MSVLLKTSFIILSLVFLVSCSPRPAQISQQKEIAPATAISSEKPTWEVEWGKTIQTAKKEGTVILYSTANASVRTATGDAFKSKFGIVLESVTGRGSEQAQRLINERRNGLYLADIYMAGTTTPLNQLKPVGVLDPMEPAFILPEVKDSKAWFGGSMQWVEADHMILAALAYPAAIILVNNQLVKKGEVKSMRDLLKPVWKGKIAVNDPTVAGAGLKTFAVMGWEIMNMDYWRDFAKQEPVIVRDQRLLVEWVAHGKYPIAFAPRAPEVNEFKTAGAPIELITPEEGGFLTTGSGGVSIINRPAHPNASKVFLNWFLSREGQTVFTRAHGGQSARIDVQTEGLDPDLIRKSDVKYFAGADSEEFLKKEDKTRDLAAEIFINLIK